MKRKILTLMGIATLPLALGGAISASKQELSIPLEPGLLLIMGIATLAAGILIYFSTAGKQT